jgi:hypothetical protein
VDNGTAYPTAGPYLEYEIERFDRANNFLDVWVRVPAVSGNSSGDYILMYYDDKVNYAVADRQNPAGVFNSSNGYVAVWHMNQDPAGGAGSIKDTTSNANNGTPGGSMGSGNLVNGIIGKGIDFDGVDDVIDCGSGATLSTSDFSIELWGFYDSTTYAWRGIVGRTGGSNQVDWGFDMNSNSRFRYWYDSTNQTTGTVVPAQTWFQATYVCEYTLWTSYGDFYLNGALVNTRTFNMVGEPSAYTFKIGKNWDPSWLGTIDEVRVSNTLRDANWVKLSYENQKAAQSLITITIH